MGRGREMLAVVGISGVLDKSLNKAVESAQKKISGINPKALKAAAAVGGIATAAFKAGKELASIGGDYQRSMNQLRASTGASEKEMKQLGETVQQVYKNNFGESMQDVSDAVAEIKKTTGLSDEALQKATEGAITLRDTLGYDVQESARAAKAMMLNFGVDGEKALSMIAAGAQNGLDYSDELLDSVSEYSVQFAKVGLSADDMFNIFQQGAESGGWSIDKVGDAVKEFSIRAIDGSDSTKGAYEKLGLSADEMMRIFAKGGPEANKSFDKVLNKLMDMDDEVERDAVGVALFGTMWEDLGTDAMKALADTESKVYDTGNALQTMQDVKYDDLQSAMEGIWRIVEVALLPIASEVANKLRDMQPQIEAAVNAAIGKIKEIAPVVKDIFKGIGAHMNIIIPIIVTLASAIGMLKFARLASEVGKYVKALKEMKAMTKLAAAASKVAAAAQKVWTAITKVAKGVAKGFSAAVKMMSWQFLLIVAAIGLVVAAGVWVYKHWDWLKERAIEIGGKIKDAFSKMKDKVVGVFSTMKEKVTGVFSAMKGKITGAASAVKGKITRVFSAMKDKIVKVFQSMRDKIGSVFGGLKELVKKPMNAVIGLVNEAIEGINELNHSPLRARKSK